MRKKVKRTIVIGLVVAGILTLGSFTVMAAPKKLSIGLGMWGTMAPFHQGMIKHLKDHIAEINAQGKYEIQLFVTDAQGKREKQLSDIEDLLAKGVDVLIPFPIAGEDALAWEKMVKESRKKTGKPAVYILLGHSPHEPITLEDLGVDFQVTVDDYASGSKIGQFLAAYLYGKKGKFEGNVIEIRGIVGDTADTLRNRGFHDVVDLYPGIKTVYEQPGNWNRMDAYNAMQVALTKFPPGSIDAVFGYNDTEALGVLQAAEEVGRGGEFLIFGVDGQSNFVRAMQEGRVTAGGVYDYRQASIAVNFALDMLEGKKVPKTYVVPHVFITQGNVWEVIKKVYKPFKCGEDYYHSKEEMEKRQ